MFEHELTAYNNDVRCMNTNMARAAQLNNHCTFTAAPFSGTGGSGGNGGNSGSIDPTGGLPQNVQRVNSNPGDDSSGLGLGAIITIGVVGALLLLALCICICVSHTCLWKPVTKCFPNATKIVQDPFDVMAGMEADGMEADATIN